MQLGAPAQVQPPGVVVVDPSTRRVLREGQPLAVNGRAFELLLVLAGQPDRVFTADELKASVWPGRILEDTNLRMQVKALRQALGAGAVVNVPGRGYKLACAAQLLPHRHPQPRRSSNLPHAAEPLLGRHDDVQHLQALLAGHRLVTVVGASGIGKTRLAQELARQQHPLLPDGAWWVDLAALSAGPQAGQALAQAVARELGLQTLALDDETEPSRVGRALARWQGLILLDNAEHLMVQQGPLAAFVLSLLTAAPGLRLLLTSQKALQLSDEWVYRLPPLPVPPADAEPGQARASVAMQLLERRARAADQRFVLADADLALATDVVRRLDGIALAIEMAAARLPELGVQALHRLLSLRLDLLGRSDDAELSRHRTLRAALDWSHDLLAPDEQVALRQLSVFAAPFRLESACQVVALPGEGSNERHVLAAILGLVDKSLLQTQPTTDAGTPARLRLLETTRLYATHALQACGEIERDGAQARHVRAMADLARQAGDEIHRLSDAVWSARWLPDHDDLMLGFDRAHARGDADAAAQIIELLVVGANITGRVDPALARAAASRELALHAAPLARARLLGWGSNLQAPGRSRLEAAAWRVQVWRDVGRPEGLQGLCTALAMQALALEEAGEQAGADVALAECRQLEDPRWSPRLRRRCTWIALSRMALLRDDATVSEQADALSRQLIQQLGQMGALRERALVQTHVAQTLRQQGLPEQALDLLQGLAAEQEALGCDIDSGISLGIASAARVESAANDAEPQLQAQAGAAARQALLRLAPLPALMRHFLEPLALLACWRGEPVVGAVLLAGADRLRRDHQYGHDPLSARSARRVLAWLDSTLGAAERTLAESRGAGLDGQALRGEALAWLERWNPIPEAGGQTP